MDSIANEKGKLAWEDTRDPITKAKEELRDIILTKVREFLETQEERYFDEFFIDSDDNLCWLDNEYNQYCDNPRELVEEDITTGPAVYLEALDLSDLISVTDRLFCCILI